MTAGGGARARVAPRRVALLLAALGIVVLAGQIAIGTSRGLHFAPHELLRGLAAMLGLREPLASGQALLELRVWSALTSAGVGACLSVAGALLQGLLRNPLADPSLLGVTSGASLGAALALLALGGFAKTLVGASLSDAGPWIVTLAALIGALAVTGLVVLLGQRLAQRGGLAMLVLLGVAINSCIAGALAALQDVLWTNQQLDTLQALQAWSMGTLAERKPYHVALVALGIAVAAVIVPRVARELDLLASGDDDARSVGVNVERVRALVVVAAAVTTACAVAAAGQIGVVGLVVPQVVRLTPGSSHRTLLGLSLLSGAVFVPGVDLAQVLVADARVLRPNVLMSLLGGPFFLALLVAYGRRRVTW